MRTLKVALDAYGREDSTIPTKFAAKVLATAAAKESPKPGPKVSGGAFLQETNKYAPASDQIFGILKQMKEDFETSLSQAQKDEVKAQDDYGNLKSTKEEQVATTKVMLENMQKELASNKKALFDAKEELQLTRDTRTEDVKFLQNLKVTCGDLDHQFEQRTKMRTEEIKAVAEAIAIITDDDNADMLRKKVTLLQIDSVSSRSMARERMLRFRAVS